MSKNLREILLNYRDQRILGDKVHVRGRKNGKVVFDGYYKIYGTIDTNFSSLTIDWPEDGILPRQYQDYYGFPNRFPVKFEYFEEDDIVHLSGIYKNDNDAPYKVVVQLPEKSSYKFINDQE